jgi:predicted ATP-grasp superfamily ATP-dependent carboligase
VRWVRLTTDVPTALREVARRQLSAVDYIRSLRGPLEYATWSLDDPIPALAEVPLVAFLAATRAITQRTRGLVTFKKHLAAQSAPSKL